MQKNIERKNVVGDNNFFNSQYTILSNLSPESSHCLLSNVSSRCGVTFLSHRRVSFGLGCSRTIDIL